MTRERLDLDTSIRVRIILSLLRPRRSWKRCNSFLLPSCGWVSESLIRSLGRD